MIASSRGFVSPSPRSPFPLQPCSSISHFVTDPFLIEYLFGGPLYVDRPDAHAVSNFPNSVISLALRPLC